MNTTRKSSDKNKEDSGEKLEALTTNIIFGTMIIFTVIGAGYLSIKLKDYLSDFEKTRPDYKVAKLQDFYIILISMPVLAVK